eukprot:2904785-Pyramimonas_sp.AAC.1
MSAEPAHPPARRYRYTPMLCSHTARSQLRPATPRRRGRRLSRPHCLTSRRASLGKDPRRGGGQSD